MTLAKGGIGGGGKIAPTTPTINLQVVGVAAGSAIEFNLQYSNTTFSTKATSTGSTVYLRIYKTSDNSLLFSKSYGEYNSNFSYQVKESGTPFVKGTSYYGNIYVVDRFGISSPASSNSPNLVARTLPSAVTNLVAAGTNSNTTNASWTASADNGGGTVSYDWEVRSNDANNTLQQSGNTTSTSVNINIGSGTYYWKVRSKNELGSTSYAQSLVVTVSAPPFFPSFGPFFPFFPSFGPYFPFFGPYFGGFY